jgi:hypothetical protein
MQIFAFTKLFSLTLYNREQQTEMTGHFILNRPNPWFVTIYMYVSIFDLIFINSLRLT